MNPLNTGGELRSPGRVSSSCSTSGTCCVILVTRWYVMNEQRTGFWLRQMEHIRGHLWHRYSHSAWLTRITQIQLGMLHKRYWQSSSKLYDTRDDFNFYQPNMTKMSISENFCLQNQNGCLRNKIYLKNMVLSSTSNFFLISLLVILNVKQHPSPHANSIAKFDFSVLYATIPHWRLKERLKKSST
jgi:hypothetical protein